MKRKTLVRCTTLFLCLSAACSDSSPAPIRDASVRDSGGGDGGSGSVCVVDDGLCIFRHDTFGDEQFWTDTLRLNELVQTLPPTTALAVGLKVDASRVPAAVLASADLSDPATTVALLGLGAVIGVEAVVDNNSIRRIGLTCASCHSTVDDSVMPGIGNRLDGYANRDLNPGAIIALTPGLPALATQLGISTDAARTVLNSWGPGRYDARLTLDGESHPVLIPPIWGLRTVALESYTGEGPISYWNAYVAVTQMGAQGTFQDPRLGIDITHDPDLLTSKLPALRNFQLSLLPPSPPAGSFDATKAARGEALFAGKAACASCHAGSAFTDAPTLHTPAEVGQDGNEARRSLTKMYRTTPLRGAWQHPPYFHDGSAATFADVVRHYDTLMSLGLTAAEQEDLIEYLKSI